MGAWKRILVAAVVGTALVFALTCCESAGSGGGDGSAGSGGGDGEDDGSGGGGTGGEAGGVGTVEYPEGSADLTTLALFSGIYDNSTQVYITDEPLTSGNVTTYVVFYILDNTAALDVDIGTYDISFDADPGDIISVEVVIGLTDTAIEYAAGTLFESLFEDKYSSRTIDRYDQIGAGDGTVDVSVSGAEYTFTWSLDVGEGESISGSFTGTQ